MGKTSLISTPFMILVLQKQIDRQRIPAFKIGKEFCPRILTYLDRDMCLQNTITINLEISPLPNNLL